MRSHRALLAAGLLLQLADASPAEVNYVNTVRPLLDSKCVSCHGAVRQEGGLRLDAGVLVRQGGDSGPIADGSHPDESLLLLRVTAPVAGDRMPPEGEGEPLTPEQVDILRKWIAAGLPSPEDEEVLASALDHWAYRPIQRSSLESEDADDTWRQRNPIDRLLARHHERLGLTPLPRADGMALLRRVTLDLTGLPPTPAEQEAFLADHSERAYEGVVDILLARPQFGERWGRHWMDVWRYSDWDGYKQQLRGSQRHIWRWRDWIVESLNTGKPYDRMIVEMLAGDEVAPSDPDIVRATGFLARNYHNSNRNIWLDATVEHTAKAFLGMTLNCARCHDHKYDPLAQHDYYAFRAVFEPHKVRTERQPGERDVNKDGLARVYDADLDAETFVFLRGDEKQPDKNNPVAPGVPGLLQLPFDVSPVGLPPPTYFPALRGFIEREEIAHLERQVAETDAAYTKLVPREVTEQGEETTVDRPPSPQAAERLNPELEAARRRLVVANTELAALKARYAADKAKHFASSGSTRPDVESPALAAARAERQHAAAARAYELFTAVEALQKAHSNAESDRAKRNTEIGKARETLVKAEKALAKARRDLLSDSPDYTSVGTIYPATSTGRRRALAEWIVNPRNPLTARVAVNHVWMRHFGRPLVDNVFDFGLRSPEPLLRDVLDWLAAELLESDWNLKHVHRLIVTSECYCRASSAETSVLAFNADRDADNQTWWRTNVRRLEAEAIRDSLLSVAGELDLTRGGADLDCASGETIPRRSMYFRHAYEKQMTMLLTFDAANPTDCYRRTTSIVPQQALALSNSGLSVSMARRFEEHRHESAPQLSDVEFVQDCFRRILCRQPTGSERDACLEFLKSQSELLSDADSLTAIESQSMARAEPAGDPHRRARQSLVHVLLNHNDFVSVR